MNTIFRTSIFFGIGTLLLGFFFVPSSAHAIITIHYSADEPQRLTAPQIPRGAPNYRTFQQTLFTNQNLDLSQVPEWQWQELEAARSPGFQGCANMILDTIEATAWNPSPRPPASPQPPAAAQPQPTASTPPPAPSCSPRNICSGGNIVNSCTGGLVQSCPHGCSGSACLPPPPAPPSNPTDSDSGGSGGSGSGSGGGGGGSGGGGGGSGSGASSQCSDGIDNDGDGDIDLSDEGCVSGSDNDEFNAPPEASISLSATPQLVRKDASVTLNWTATDVQSCALSGTNGDSWNLSGSSGSEISSALTSETTFTLSCLDLSDETVLRTATVKLTPSFQEI